MAARIVLWHRYMVKKDNQRITSNHTGSCLISKFDIEKDAV
ncbi:hypothetical protein ES705_28854 [subsurface metagenome]